jgi:hypothetical protein
MALTLSLPQSYYAATLQVDRYASMGARQVVVDKGPP